MGLGGSTGPPLFLTLLSLPSGLCTNDSSLIFVTSSLVFTLFPPPFFSSCPASCRLFWMWPSSVSFLFETVRHLPASSTHFPADLWHSPRPPMDAVDAMQPWVTIVALRSSLIRQETSGGSTARSWWDGSSTGGSPNRRQRPKGDLPSGRMTNIVRPAQPRPVRRITRSLLTSHHNRCAISASLIGSPSAISLSDRHVRIHHIRDTAPASDRAHPRHTYLTGCTCVGLRPPCMSSRVASFGVRRSVR